MPEGPGAGAVAALWLAVCVCATAGGVAVAGRVVAGDSASIEVVRWPLAMVTLAVGLGYLSVGGAWLVISRLGLNPFDLSTDIVRLTAVHFHYAGFGMAAARRHRPGVRRLDGQPRGAVDRQHRRIAGPPIVAAGFVSDSALAQVGGRRRGDGGGLGGGFGTFLLATSNSQARVVPSWERGLAQWVGRILLRDLVAVAARAHAAGRAVGARPARRLPALSIEPWPTPTGC